MLFDQVHFCYSSVKKGFGIWKYLGDFFEASLGSIQSAAILRPFAVTKRKSGEVHKTKNIPPSKRFFNICSHPSKCCDSNS